MAITSEQIKTAIKHFEFLRTMLKKQNYTKDGLTIELNMISYYLDHALNEATGDEAVLELRDKALDRKRARIKDIEEELQACYKALNDMSARCDEQYEVNRKLKTELDNVTENYTNTKTMLDYERERASYLAEECNKASIRSDELQTKLDKQNEILMKMLYGLPIS